MTTKLFDDNAYIVMSQIGHDLCRHDLIVTSHTQG